MIRCAAALCLVALAALTVWGQRQGEPGTVEPIVTAQAYRSDQSALDGPVQVRDLYRLTSPQPDFGGFSALAWRGGRLVLFSDYGLALELPELPADGGRIAAPSRRIGTDTIRKSGRDIEAAASEGGSIWLALENTNAIVRLDGRLAQRGAALPQALADWPANGGPEALARLADGRFLVLREGRVVVGDTDPLAGVLFAGDPTAGATSRNVAITGADGYHPVDAASAPDGRILVLLRRLGFGWPFDFRSRLAWLDPADLDDGSASLSSPIDLSVYLPDDNYEGLAVRAAGERWDVWVVSDDNNSHFQANWLARLSLDPAGLPE